MIDISQAILEPIVEELTNEARFGRRATEMLANPRDRRRIWLEVIRDAQGHFPWADIINPDREEAWLFGMKIVYLHCIPEGRAVIVSWGESPTLIQDGPDHLAIIPT